MKDSKYARKAMDLFKEGYNCSQAVVLAFEDQYAAEKKDVARLASSFGGGMARLREVCGCVTGMFMVAGLLYGYDDPKDREQKIEHYKRIQELAEQFRKVQGSIVCRELLGLDVKKESYMPEERTKEYYKKRPCMELVGFAASLMEDYIRQNPVSDVSF